MRSATMPLGRLIRHDARSRLYPAPQVDEPTGSAFWRHYGAPLDQGQLGSCTGNAAAQLLMTAPLRRNHRALTEKAARSIYSLATTIDDVAGTWPPTDTGSSGLAVAKACKRLGYITGYSHAFGIDHARRAIEVAPFIVGTDWWTGMDDVDAAGRVHPTGSIAGGHEYLCVGFDEPAGDFLFVNSWGPSWGVPIPECHVTAGGFRITALDFAGLLAARGDVTVFTA